ncbi:hypothetical protein BX666DRAFT_498537 [Dichotomocladium elegans]|nr:hypothetical protein BX666DRAFT_498537 [Dichotomocladium elegans]
MTGYVAIIISTALIVVFSEILPQAICSRYGLAIGAFFAIPVRVLIFIWYLIAWPMAKVLDLILGKHRGFMYGKSELSELIHLHGDPLRDGPLEKNTVEILQSVLDLSGKNTGDLVAFSKSSKRSVHRQPTPLLMLDMDTLLTIETANAILKSGMPAVPVYSSKEDGHPKIQGILQTKSIVLQSLSEKIPLRKLTLEPVLCVPSSASAVCLLQILAATEPSQMALIYSLDDSNDLSSAPGLRDNRIFRHGGSAASMKQLHNIVPLGIVTLSELLDGIFSPSTPIRSKNEQHVPEEILIHRSIEPLGAVIDEKLQCDITATPTI